MPEAVDAWFDPTYTKINDRIDAIEQIHTSLITGYERDFGKYSDGLSAQHIQAIFKNVPQQLSKNIDGSVQRFQFKGVYREKKPISGISWAN